MDLTKKEALEWKAVLETFLGLLIRIPQLIFFTVWFLHPPSGQYDIATSSEYAKL